MSISGIKLLYTTRVGLTDAGATAWFSDYVCTQPIQLQGGAFWGGGVTTLVSSVSDELQFNTVVANNIVSDANTQTGNVEAFVFSDVISAGGSLVGVGTQGVTAIDFGAAPGSTYTTAVVTGQTNIKATSVVTALLMAEATASHNALEHAIAPIQISAGNVVAGTGFTIYASTDLRFTGTFNVRWSWQ